jgi:hypothetical protein
VNGMTSRPSSLEEVKNIDQSETYRLDDVEWLERELGPVDIYRAAITAATRLMLALKLSAVLS